MDIYTVCMHRWLDVSKVPNQVGWKPSRVSHASSRRNAVGADTNEHALRRQAAAKKSTCPPQLTKFDRLRLLRSCPSTQLNQTSSNLLSIEKPLCQINTFLSSGNQDSNSIQTTCYPRLTISNSSYEELSFDPDRIE